MAITTAIPSWKKKALHRCILMVHGLSYTTFKVSDAEFGTTEDGVAASCTVKNTGDRAGTEVVQMYVGFSHSKVDRPVKILRGFTRVALNREKKRKSPSPARQKSWLITIRNTRQMQVERWI